jgi:hypothetical protein
MRKLHFAALVGVVVVLCAFGAWVLGQVQLRADDGPPISISDWNTYTDPDTGFSISFPQHYSAQQHLIATDTPWGTRTLVSIDPALGTSTNEFHIEAAQVILERQPIVASGEIFHTIAAYRQSGVAAQMVQGATEPDGALVKVNAMQALEYHFPAGDASDVAHDAYFFIRDDLIYEVDLSSSDPYEGGMLNSIMWR